MRWHASRLCRRGACTAVASPVNFGIFSQHLAAGWTFAKPLNPHRFWIFGISAFPAVPPAGLPPLRFAQFSQFALPLCAWCELIPPDGTQPARERSGTWSDRRCIERQTLARYRKPPFLSITMIYADIAATHRFIYCDFLGSRSRHIWGAATTITPPLASLDQRAGNAVTVSGRPGRATGSCRAPHRGPAPARRAPGRARDLGRRCAMPR